MAIDTKEKRLAFIEFGGGYSWHTLFDPDDTITAGDRAHLLGLLDILAPNVIGLGGVRLAPVLYSGFRPHHIVQLSSTISASSISTVVLGVTREHKLISIPVISIIAVTLDVSDQLFFVATVSSSAAISPSLDVTREMDSVVNSLSAFSIVSKIFISLGTVQIASISTIVIPLFGEFVTDLGTIRFSPMSSPGFDFFVPPPPDIPPETKFFVTISSNISAMLPTLSVTKGIDLSIDSVSTSVASMSTEVVSLSGTIASIGVVGA